MSVIPILSNEKLRQAALNSYHILDSATESDFDDLAELASAICKTPIALIGFIDDNRHWFKAHKGTELTESEKSISFCAHAIASPKEIMVVEDATQDIRFKENPVVTGMNLTFYAGVPLVSSDGFALGTLCVFDQQARSLLPEQEKALRILGRQVMDKLELRKKVWELEAANLQIAKLNIAMENHRAELQLASEETAVLNEELRTTNEELLAINEEMAAVNEEMTAMNEELKEAYLQQEELNSRLKVKQKKIKGALEQISLAKQAAQLGMFDLDVPNDKLVWDERCKELFGVSASKEVAYTTDFVEGLHPEDRDKTLKAVADAYDQLLTFGKYDVEYRTIGADDGQVRFVRAIGQVFFDEHRQPQRFIGTVMDITEAANARIEILKNRAELQETNEELAATNEELAATNEELQSIHEEMLINQEQLKENEGRLRLITDNISQLVWMADPAGDIYWYNERWYQYTGKSSEDMKGRGWQMVHHPDYVKQVTLKYEACMTSENIWEDTFPLLGADGQYRWFLSRAVPFKNDAGEVVSWFGTNTDVTEQKQDDQRKNDFISMVSHELKTPLTSTIGYVQVTQNRAIKKDDALTSGMMERAGKQLGKMTSMINGFLNVSRLESGKIHIDKQPFDMASLIKEVEEEHMTHVTGHRVVFSLVQPSIIVADRDKIGQVINNFISNALKYSPVNSTITVTCETEGDQIQVAVKDQGMGIPATEQPRLFERYYRVKGDHMTSISGFGIGLYLCKEIIDRHRGNIGVDSIPDNGSTFWFTLPAEN
jgi:PAS domain S-box-containing protein